ncbi:MAG: FAD-dependent oxidoreductase [Pseudomonadales bacterium]
MEQWDHSVDVVVVGSGNGGLTAALSCYESGTEDVLVLEKHHQFGGTSALSGGGIWIPNNHYAIAAGANDSPEEAREYLRQTIPEGLVPDDLLDTYLREAPNMLRFLHDNTQVRYQSLAEYPDYYSHLPGAKEGHRSLEPQVLNISDLGDEWKNLHPAHIMMYVFGKFTITQKETWLIVGKNPGWKRLILKRFASWFFDFGWRLKSPHSRRIVNGQAGVARLILSMQDRDLPLWRNCALQELITDSDNRVIGLIANHEGKILRIHARKGVILAAGGFEHNQTMREQYLPPPTNREWSSGIETNTGDAIRAAQAIGAQTQQMSGAWWCTTISFPGEIQPRLSITDKSLPGNCVVNKNGMRIGNESQNYMAYQQAWLASHSEDAPAVPAWMVFDANYRSKYKLGPMMDGKLRPDHTLPREWLDSGFLTISNTVEELAEKTGIDAIGLKSTLDAMNGYAETGKDLDFRRGDSAYDRYYGDSAVQPNPCLAPINKPPFYAVRVQPGDFGTQGGLQLNRHAQVLNHEQEPIPGLYATGNCTAAILPTYPGPGSTLGPAMAFGYLAGRHVSDKS